MSATEPGGGFGTVYHPGPDLTPDGESEGIARGQLRSLPRRRRPLMVALAVALVGAGILASAALYQQENHQVPVLVVTANVAEGSVIGADDVGTTSVAAGPGVQTVPAGQLRQVVGLVAATPLRQGSLLAPADVATSQPPGRGQVLVPLPVRPSGLPASGLAQGDRVIVVPTTSSAGGTASGGGGGLVLTHPVAGIVQAVTLAPDTDGFDVVDLLVPAASGTDLAEQAATSDIWLYVTSRSPR
ncbi:MAG TPA: SAF domain-containing protein [Streptosporangiaceae bacterium]|nr:SAF domain-containing protein [Streptosporangiaceae bacterium]